MRTNPVLVECHGDVKQLGRADQSTAGGEVLALPSPLVDQEVSLVVVVVVSSNVTWGRIFRVFCRDGRYKNTYVASNLKLQY